MFIGGPQGHERTNKRVQLRWPKGYCGIKCYLWGKIENTETELPEKVQKQTNQITY
jgi:hypothetical protein